MSKVYVGIDASLRSSAVVAIDENYQIVFAELLQIEDTLKDEQMLWAIQHRSRNLFEQLYSDFDVEKISIERLAHGGASGSKDKICAGWWCIRMSHAIVAASFLNKIEMGTVAVNTWRAAVINEADRKKNKENPSPTFLKDCPYEKLPSEARILIDKKCEGLKKKDSHYDLTDAYWLARYVHATPKAEPVKMKKVAKKS